MCTAAAGVQVGPSSLAFAEALEASLDSSSEKRSTGEYPMFSSSSGENGGESASWLLGEYDGSSGPPDRNESESYRSGDDLGHNSI